MEAVTAAALAAVAALVGYTSHRVDAVVEGVVADTADTEVMEGMEVMGAMGVMEVMAVMEVMEAMGGIVHMEAMGVMGMGLMGLMEAMGDLGVMGGFLQTQLFCGMKTEGHYPPYIFHQGKGIEVGVVVKEAEGVPPRSHCSHKEIQLQERGVRNPPAQVLGKEWNGEVQRQAGDLTPRSSSARGRI